MDKSNKLVTDFPMTNLEVMLNYAYDKEGRVYLHYADGTDGYELCNYISDQLANLGYEISPNKIMENGVSFGNEETEPLAILYTVAVQAAELRARLKQYEEDDGK